MTLSGVLALASVSFVAERNFHNLANGTGRIAASHAVSRVESKSVISFNIIRDYLKGTGGLFKRGVWRRSLFVHEHLRRRDPNGVALESLNKRNHPPTSLVDGCFIYVIGVFILLIFPMLAHSNYHILTLHP